MADVLDLQEHERCHGRVIPNPAQVEAPPIRLRKSVHTRLGRQAGSQPPPNAGTLKDAIELFLAVVSLTEDVSLNLGSWVSG